ncbi:MAG: SpoIIE family protein phosphatase [Candidatus Omnitrophica bacterium]|nr:SpoIIE family protein phosphatase [Candidatus Omnitrophota bacterium]
MIKSRGIRFKLVFFILSSCALIFAVIFAYNYFFSRRIIEKNIKTSAENLVLATINRIDAVLSSVEKVPQTIAYFLEYAAYDKEEILSFLSSVVEGNSDIYGSTIAFEPYAFRKDALYFAPYFCKSGEGLKFTYIGSDNYRYFEWDWYKAPKELGRPVWTEPYYDEGAGNIIMSTYSAPFYKGVEGQKRFMGIVTADISLSWLQKIVSSIKIGKTGYAFLISKNGTIVTHPLEELIMHESVFGLAEARNDRKLLEISREMTEGKSGFVAVRDIVSGKICWLAFTPVASSGWSLGVLFPQDELMGDVTELNIVVLALGVTGFLFLLAIIFLISGKITRPLRALAKTTEDIAHGNFDFVLPQAKSRDEVGVLSNSFIYMRDALKKYIKELTETVASKERMESELKIAHDIQMGIIPRVFPPFPDRKEFDIYAALVPAREVGGDFYDFFFINDKDLCFVIADVSDKGVPAALFMSLTKALIKAIAREDRPADEILNRVNKEISQENDSLMFITVFLGILNTETGQLSYVNAGHNPALVLRDDEKPLPLKGAPNTAVGLKQEAAFRQEKILLQPGDCLILYTDGVTEAFNKKEEQFTQGRLEEALSISRSGPLAELISGLLEKIKTFSDGAPQSDDITLMALKYLGANKKTVILKNKLSELSGLAQEVSRFGKDNNLSKEIIHDLNLSLEEIISNTINYGYKDSAGHQISVEVALSGSIITVKITDDAQPFNPLQASAPELEKPPSERKPGGMGVHLVRNLMDKIEYKREEGRNILLISKNIP